ncbi:hypothetical protein AYR46_06495 [Sphingobium yanoikuyae]|nr:hypothetical protein AYR46_06495 [Sphingobium yanoikuyae]
MTKFFSIYFVIPYFQQTILHLIFEPIAHSGQFCFKVGARRNLGFISIEYLPQSALLEDECTAPKFTSVMR